MRPVGHSSGSKDELISNVFICTHTHGYASVGD